MAESRDRPLVFLAIVAAGGAVVGALGALFSENREPVFLTDTISYVPTEAWWLHGIVVGVTLAILSFAVIASLWMMGWLFRHGLAFLVVGLMMAGMGALMIWLALTPGTIDDDLRMLFGWGLGPVSGFFGAWALMAHVRSRKRTRKKKAKRRAR